MAPILHIVRHAQGLHNVFPGNDALVDPELTSTGIAQCVALREAFPHHDQLTHLAASPMRRAIQTCLTAFGKPVLMDVLQETSDAPNDTGSSVEALRAEFGDAVDVSCVSAAWTDKGEGSFFAPEIEQVVARAAVARNALRALAGDGDGHVVCVTHGGFVHFLTDDWEGISLQRRALLFSAFWIECG
jgi:broad specificity phosphatase PhoE